MDMQTLRRPLLVVLSALGLTLSGFASAEPPSRAARLGYMSGTVSFSPAGQPDWVQAVVNRPLTTGDRLWVDANSRAELQIGGAAIRLGSATSVTLLNLDDRIAQVQLTQGSLKVRVRHMGPGQSFEVDTPNLAFTLRRPGEYRIDVDSNDDATAVMVQSGEAEVYGEDASYTITSRQGYRFYGTGLSDYDSLGGRRDDDLDRWARERDRRGDNSASARYVSQEVVGYEDLDTNGTWRSDPNYGNVWTPTRVAAGWTPYHDGHWAWVDPWGWTWVDDAPWGFAVSHYGRWANFNGTWGWVPGPPREQAVYAPALVAFVGGRNFQVSASVGSVLAAAVGWFPLAPREVYQPSYPVSRGYFDNINRSNAVIAPTTITNVYNTTNITNTTIVNNTTKVVYVNQQVTGAVVAVPAQAFTQSQSVAKAAVQLPKEVALSAPVAQVASVAPVQQSVHGGAPVALAKPPARELAVVAHTAPPPPPVPFIEQQKHLAANPGKPIDEAQRVQLKPAVLPGPEAKVSVIAAARAPAPAAPPPATPPAPKTPEARKVDAAKAEAAVLDRKPDDARAAAARAEAAKAEAAKIEGAKADAVKADGAKAAAAAATAKADLARSETAKAEAAKTEAARVDAANAETAKAVAAKGEAAKAEAAKAAAAKAEAARVETVKAEAAKADSAKAEAMKAESARALAAKAEAAQADAKATAAKAEASKADATRAEAARVDAAKTAAAKAEAARAEATQADMAKAKAEASRAEAARSEAARAEGARAAAAKADTARVEAAQAEAARTTAAKAEASKAEAAKLDAARAAAARAEAARADAARAEAAKAAGAKAEAAKAEAARAEAARAEAARAAQARPVAGGPPAQHASSPRPAPDVKGDEEPRKR